MSHFVLPAHKVAAPLAPMAAHPVPSLPIRTAEGLATLIRRIQAEMVVEPATRPLPTPRSPQVRFGMD
jgi:hypothetical protein